MSKQAAEFKPDSLDQHLADWNSVINNESGDVTATPVSKDAAADTGVFDWESKQVFTNTPKTTTQESISKTISSEPKRLKSSVELALEKEGIATAAKPVTAEHPEGSKPLKSAVELSLEREGLRPSVAKEQTPAEDPKPITQQVVSNNETTIEPKPLKSAVELALDKEGVSDAAEPVDTHQSTEPTSKPLKSAVELSLEREGITQDTSPSPTTPEQDQPNMDQQRLIFNEQILQPGGLTAWRQELSHILGQSEDLDDEMKKQVVSEFINNKLQPLDSEGLASEDLKQQLADLMLDSPEDFQAYVRAHDSFNEVKPEDLTDEARKEGGYSLSLRATTYIQSRWQYIKDWANEKFEDGEKAKRNRVILGIGSLAAVAAGTYAAYKYGVAPEAGSNELASAGEVAAAGGIENGTVADIAENTLTAPAENAAQEAPLSGLPVETEIQDLSQQLGLPEGYIIETPDGFEITAMAGNETDSIWRAAEHALTSYLERQPSIDEINSLQNLVGDHWLDVGDKVTISEDMIKQALGLS